MCRKLCQAIDTEACLQYILLLDREGMLDGSSECKLTVQDRLFLLQSQTRAWATLSHEAVIPLSRLWVGRNAVRHYLKFQRTFRSHVFFRYLEPYLPAWTLSTLHISIHSDHGHRTWWSITTVIKMSCSYFNTHVRSPAGTGTSSCTSPRWDQEAGWRIRLHRNLVLCYSQCLVRAARFVQS